MHTTPHPSGRRAARRHWLQAAGRYALGCAALAALPMQSALAEAGFPNRAVTLIVGYPAGGAIDQSARILGKTLAERLGQPVVVDNRPGANGTIAATAVANAKPDGYTLLVTATSHNLNKFVHKGLRYDVEKSFSPVALTVEVPTLLVVSADSPSKTVQQLLTAIRQQSKPMSYGSQGIGGVPHMAGEIFKMRTKTDLLHVPYKGASQGMTDLIGGTIDLFFPSPGSVMGLITQGKLRALAVASNERLAALPDVPTFAEQGIADYQISTWHGVLAPAGTPATVIETLNRAINEIVATDAFKQELAATGNLPAKPLSTQEYARKLASELADYEQVAKAIKLGE